MSYSIREKMQLASWYYIDKVKTTFRDLSISNPKAWDSKLWNLYGLLKTSAGIQVNQDVAMTLSAVYNAINVIAGAISTLPIHLYQKQSNGKRKIVVSHPSLKLLTYKANHLIPSINYREVLMVHILGWGNTYSEIVTNRIGQIMELWPIPPDRVTPEWGGGTVKYRINVGTKDVYLPREKMMHIAGLGYDGIIGYSVITKAAESIGLALGSERFGARYFGSNTNIGGAIKFPRALGKDAKKNLKNSLAEYTGSENSHRWMILEQGLEIEKMGFSPDDSQFLQTRQFQVTEVARWFNLPPHKLKDLSRSTFSNIEEQEIEFVVSCLRPWLEKSEQHYNIHLLTEKETDEGYYFKHSVEGLLRGSSVARADYYTKRFYLGTITPNEIRALEDDEPLDNENADKAFIQMNLMPLDEADKVAPQPQGGGIIPDDDGDEETKTLDWAKKEVRLLEYRNIAGRDKISKRYHKLIEEAAAAIVWKETGLVGKKFNGTPEDIERIYKKFDKYIRRRLGPVFDSFGESIYYQALLEIGESVEEMPKEMLELMRNYTDSYATRHIGSSKGQLIKIIDQTEDDLTEAVNERIGEWKEKRARKIANNESVRYSSFVAQAGFFAYGYKSYWRIRGPETCPYCTDLNGRSIKQGQSFFNGGEEHKPKGVEEPMLVRGLTTHPPLHQGCDCYISVR